MDVKKLTVVVEQKGIAPTATNLNRLAKASEGAQKPLERLSSTLGSFKSVNLDQFSAKLQDTTQAIKDVKASTSGMADMAKNIGGLSVSLTSIANATDRLSAKTSDISAYVTQLKAMRTELEGMKGLSVNVGGATATRTSGGTRSSSNVDSDAKAQARLSQQIERTAMMAGRTKSEYLALRAAQMGLTDSTSAHIARIAQYEKNTNGATMSTKQFNAAMRMVPAQFTDIATQLAGGQSPMLILMQQGGQLRDMFNGVGGALKAVGQQLKSYLTNPILLAAAAIGTILYSLYKASSELDDFNKALITTNGISGISINTFYKYRDSISSIAGSKSDATEALSAIAASGKIASQDVESVGVAAVKMNKVSGQAIAETVKDFESLVQKPSEAIIKLNDKYHFLTASVYDQITALEKQGKTAEASALATQTYETAINNMAAESTSKLGWVLQGWEAIKKAVISVKDAVLDMGVASNKKQLDLLRTQIDDTAKAIDSAGEGNIGGRYGKSKKQLEEQLTSLLAQRDALKENMAIEDRAAVIRKGWADDNKKAVDARTEFNKLLEENLSKQEKKQREINKLKAQYGDLENRTAQDTLAYQQKLADIEKKYKEAPDNSAKKAQTKFDAAAQEEAAIKGVIASLKEESANIEANGLAYDKVNEHAKAAAKWKLQAATAGVSPEAKAHALKMAAYESEANSEQKVRDNLLATKKAEEAYNDVVNKHAQDIADLNLQYEQESKYITMTTKEKAAAQALYANEVAMQKEILELRKQYKNAKPDSKEAEYLDMSVANTREAYAQKAQMINANLALQEKELSWYDNLTVATKQYAENLGTYNSQVQSGMMSVFSTLDSALTNFVSGTKQSFKDLAVSVLKQIAVMLAKIAIMKAAMAVVGMVSGGSSGSIDTSAGSGFDSANWGMASAKGNAFTGTGVAKFATGGTFTNGIVNSPTPFRFASGGTFNNGVMGEAGPEAVMPLTRTANGNLGVETTGTGGTQNNIAVSVTMNSNGTSTTTTQSDDKNNAKALGELIARKVKEVMTQEQRPGGMLATR